MESLKEIKDVTYSVKEHTRAIREFKHDMYMRYINTDSQDKKDIILNKVQNIEQVMTMIYDTYKSECKRFVVTGMEQDQLDELVASTVEFYEEVLSLR